MTSLLPYIQGTFFGFLYLTALFFLMLSFLKINDLTPSPIIEKFAPFIAIVIVFASSIIGLAAQSIMVKILGLIFSDNTPNIADSIVDNPLISDYLKNVFYAYYSNLVMFRHLFTGSILVGISLFVWLRKQDSKYRRYLPSCFYLLAIIFAIAYFTTRSDFIKVKEQINKITHAP